MRWGSFIFGLMIFLFSLFFGGFGLLIILGLPAFCLMMYGLFSESSSEKAQIEQVEEIKKLREEVKELKKADNVK
ncbi:hypothetical protein D4Q76_00370 [archaeon]|nr:MAG: hypothetical protein D4Q76_00370 [archaeon]